MLLRRKGSDGRTPFVAAVQSASPGFINEMIVSKLFVDSDFENSLKFLVDHSEFMKDKTIAVLSMPVDNRVERAKAVLRPIKMRIKSPELFEHFQANGVLGGGDQ